MVIQSTSPEILLRIQYYSMYIIKVVKSYSQVKSCVDVMKNMYKKQ